MALIATHVGATLHHHYVRRGGLLFRMGFRRAAWNSSSHAARKPLVRRRAALYGEAMNINAQTMTWWWARIWRR